MITQKSDRVERFRHEVAGVFADVRVVREDSSNISAKRKQNQKDKARRKTKKARKAQEYKETNLAQAC